MESARFDRFARLLGAATTRRAGIGLAVAALTGAAIAEPASAATTCRRGRQTCQRNNQCCSGTCQTGRGVPVRDRNRCTCEGGLEVCGNACVDIETDERHCGACGNRCGAGDRCLDGRCRINQQCYTDDGGVCYMTPDGREHRADGLYFFHLVLGEYDMVPCTVNSDCAGAFDFCDQAGIDCTCVRAFDFGGGYRESEESGTGTCLPLLDNGDGEVHCQADMESTVCGYSAAEQEVFMCTAFITEEGPCNGSTCTGVGACDEPGVDCACIIALKVPMFGPTGIYVDVTPFQEKILEPTCLSYTSPVDGVCLPPT